MSLPEGVNVVRRWLKGGLTTYYYFQAHRGTDRAGKPTRLPDDPTSLEFWTALSEAREGIMPIPEPVNPVLPGSFTDLINRYRESPEWARLRPATHAVYNIQLSRIGETWGALPVKQLRKPDVYAFRDSMADTPTMANHAVKVLRTLLEFGIMRDFIETNAAQQVKLLQVDESGATPWPDDAYRFVLDNAPEDIRRFAILGRATGQRRADLVRMSPAHRDADGIMVRISKLRDKLHWVPLTQAAIREIDSWGVLDLDLYLKSATGRPYSPETFSVRWNLWRHSPAAEPIKTVDLTLHGLRATAVCDRRAAGLSFDQIAAQIGMSPEMVQQYSRFGDRRRFASAGMSQLEKARSERER